MIFGDNFYVITTWVQGLVKKTIYDEFSCTLKQSFTIISKDANQDSFTYGINGKHQPVKQVKGNSDGNGSPVETNIMICVLVNLHRPSD